MTRGMKIQGEQKRETLEQAERCFRLARAIRDDAASAALQAYGRELLAKAKELGLGSATH